MDELRTQLRADFQDLERMVNRGLTEWAGRRLDELLYDIIEHWKDYDRTDPDRAVCQTMTKGGSLHGYTPEECAAHLWAKHAVVGGGERYHLLLHENGADHVHYLTETGALALSVHD